MDLGEAWLEMLLGIQHRRTPRRKYGSTGIWPISQPLPRHQRMSLHARIALCPAPPEYGPFLSPCPAIKVCPCMPVSHCAPPHRNMAHFSAPAPPEYGPFLCPAPSRTFGPLTSVWLIHLPRPQRDEEAGRHRRPDDLGGIRAVYIAECLLLCLRSLRGSRMRGTQ